MNLNATGMEEWEKFQDSLLEQDAAILRVVGAGSVNQINTSRIGEMIETASRLIQDRLDSGKPVFLLYDGDPDQPESPDVGHIVGVLADRFRDERVKVVAVQIEGWCSDAVKRGEEPIKSHEYQRGAVSYDTYVIPDDHPGGSAALNQSSRLVNSGNYEVLVCGPVGKITIDQLKDLNEVASNPVPVTLLIAEVNEEPGTLLQQKYEKIGSECYQESDQNEKSRLEGQAQDLLSKIRQRQNNPLGLLLTRSGELSESAQAMNNLNFTAGTSQEIGNVVGTQMEFPAQASFLVNYHKAQFFRDLIANCRLVEADFTIHFVTVDEKVYLSGIPNEMMKILNREGYLTAEDEMVQTPVHRVGSLTKQELAGIAVAISAGFVRGLEHASGVGGHNYR